MQRPRSLLELLDAAELDLSRIRLEICVDGHGDAYASKLDRARMYLTQARAVVERNTGEYPALPRERRDTPESPTPRDEDLPPTSTERRPIVEYRRRPRRPGDDNR